MLVPMPTFRKSVLILLLFITTGLHAQPSLFEQVEIQTTTIEKDTVGSGETLRLSITTGKELTTTLSDTTNIASVRVKLGDSEGSGNLLTQTFSFAGSQASSTIWLERTLNRLRFGLGTLTDKDSYYVKLEALNSGGAVIGEYSTIAY